MNKKQIAIPALFLLFSLMLLNACKKDEDKGATEPIQLIAPDSAIIRKFPGDDMPVEIKYTTDRPLNWVLCLYDVDTTQGAAGYTPAYADTLFYEMLDTLDPRVNIYSQSATFHVPDTLDPYDVVRFKTSFHAGKTTFTVGQNYPAGIVTFSKEFRVDVR